MSTTYQTWRSTSFPELYSSKLGGAGNVTWELGNCYCSSLPTDWWWEIPILKLRAFSGVVKAWCSWNEPEWVKVTDMRGYLTIYIALYNLRFIYFRFWNLTSRPVCGWFIGRREKRVNPTKTAAPVIKCCMQDVSLFREGTWYFNWPYPSSKTHTQHHEWIHLMSTNGRSPCHGLLPMVSHKIANYDHNIYTYAGANSINSCIQLNSSPEPRTHQRNRLVYVQWNAWFAHLSGNHLIQFGLVWNVRFLKTVPAEGERIKKHTGQRRSGKKLPPMKTTFLSMLSQ